MGIIHFFPVVGGHGPVAQVWEGTAVSVQGTGLQIRGEALSPSTASVSGSDHKVLGRASPSAPLTVKAALLIPLGQPHPDFPLAADGQTQAHCREGREPLEAGRHLLEMLCTQCVLGPLGSDVSPLSA